MVKTRRIVRAHDRHRKDGKSDSKGERFHLQGARWRFPRNLTAAEVDIRIGRLRSLWSDLEQFVHSSAFINISSPDNIRDGNDWGLNDAIASVLASPPDVDNGPEPPQTQSWLHRTIKRSGIVRETRPPSWSSLPAWIALQIRNGIQPLPLPPLPELVKFVRLGEKIEYRFRFLAGLLMQPSESQPSSIEFLATNDAIRLHRALSAAFPSVSWVLFDRQIREIVQTQSALACQATRTMREVGIADSVALVPIRPEGNALREAPTEDCLPTDDLTTSSPATEKQSQKAQEKKSRVNFRGSFHEALRCYMEKRRADFTTGETFDGSGHHMLGLIENVEKRQPNMPLSMLDFTACQTIYDFWRDRPASLRTGKALSKKHCSSHIGELDRFFAWLHKTPSFAWRRPADFDLIDKKVKRIDSDRRSLQSIELRTFAVEHLALLYKHANPRERLHLVWCLNCAHGAAELGRVEWGDIYIRQPHPWISEGLKYDGDSQDSWCGLLRPKTDVIGWWWLWPETVQLVEWWVSRLQQDLKRELLVSDRLLLSSNGEPLYRDSSRNAQTAFANLWTRLHARVARHEGRGAVPKLPFGTLRDQMSNWLGSDENQAVLASTALAHGIPHRSDKLLYKHYSNRPWARLFAAQKEYRRVLQPMFDLQPDPLREG